MSTVRTLERALVDVGELVARHDSARGLDAFSRYATDPVGFVRDVLGGNPWSRQVEIAQAVRDRPLVVVRSANAVGKDWTVARLALWWAIARRGLALVTGPTERQVREVVMGEIARAFRRVRDLPGELYTSALRLGPEEHGGILAFTSTEASRLTGFHAPRVLALITEAQAVEDFAWEGLLSCATGEDDRVLAVGNPLSPEGRYYAAARSSTWHSIRIPASEHPNLEEGRQVIPGGPSRAFVERIRQEYGEDSPQFRARVEAIFPEQTEDAAFLHDHRDRATELYRCGAFEGEADGRLLDVAVDVAGAGVDPDRTALCVRQGPIVREFHTWRGLDTREVATRVRHEVSRLCHEMSGVRTVYVDTVGPGGPGVYDRLRDELPEVRFFYSAGSDGYRKVREASPAAAEFKASHRAQDPERYVNMKAQAFHRLRRLLDDGEIAIPNDAGLWEELLAHRLRSRPDGRMEVVGKDDVRARIGRSPDLADALVMTLTPDLEGPNESRVRWSIR